MAREPSTHGDGAADEALIERVAALAHDCWRAARAAEAADALGSSQQLDATDQALIGARVDAENAIGWLAKLAEPWRGPDRPLRPEELRVGLPVGWAAWLEPDEPGRDLAAERGHVVDWAVEAGIVTELTVEWAGGTRTSHRALDGELRRLA